jgi:DNA replication ATP-dependent helicase/nuclease Dna2
VEKGYTVPREFVPTEEALDLRFASPRTRVGPLDKYSCSAMVSVHSLIESLLESSLATVGEAGDHLLRVLSDSQLQRDDFLNDPLILIGPPYFASRYLAQVALRALQNEYETLDEVLASLNALVERNPPILEPKREILATRILLPEAKVVELRYPQKGDDNVWESSIEALVTSGPLRDREIRIRIRSDQNRTLCFSIPHLWIHAAIAAYNLVPADDGVFVACPETFVVLEPMRQVNATSIARSLHCTKPQVDQIRRGKGDVTVHTLKGQLVHALFDRLLEGGMTTESDLESAYRSVIPAFLVPLASVTDEFFDEEAFRIDVLRHTSALKEFIDRNPHLLEHTQLELKRYSATIGIQGRIDAVFREGNRLDILELKTGARIRPEDHAQLFIYRLLLSDLIRRWQRSDGQDVEITSRLLSSIDGSFAPLRVMTDFYQVLDARNKLIAMQYALGRDPAHIAPRYEGFNEEVCKKCPSWTRNRCKESSDLFGDRPVAAETAELEYFRKFTRLVESEKWHADHDLADLLDDSRLQFRVSNFRAIHGARIVLGAEPFTFQFEENTSDLEVGDSVLIHAGRISSTATYHGYVREIDTRRLRVAVPLKNLDARVFEGQSWIVDRFPTDVTAEASHTALYDFLVSPMDEKKRAILRVGRASDPLPPTAALPLNKGENCARDHLAAFLPTFNASQLEAIHRAVNCSVFHLIWGPPGTGKTKVIPQIVRRVSGPVLLGAFTNTAVDKMLIALLDDDPTTRFLRVGRSSDSPELVRKIGGDPTDFFTDDVALKHGTVRAVKQALQRAQIVAATAHRSATLPYLRRRAFEMSIVDEAGQLTEPLTLGLTLRARRFVLIGDDRQLPPVVRTRGLAHSMFERLKRDPDAVTMLKTQYRMHPEIMSISNRLFYDGRLEAGIKAVDRTPPDGPDSTPVQFIPVESEREGRSNPDEARIVFDLVRLFTQSHGIQPESIGVVSPFRAQVVLLRQMLGGTGVTVDTVERFQGGERDIMILSFVRSRGTGFVFDDRRLNVAITRARRKLVLVAHPRLFLKSRYAWICTFTETLKTAGTT